MSSVIENLAPAQNANKVLDAGYVKVRRISIKEYDLMNENGVFEEDDNIEL